jgi:hypothetical protein
MSLFGKILSKLGLRKDKEAEAAQEKALADMARKEAEARAKMQAAGAKPAASAPAAKPASGTPQPSAAASAPAAPASTPPAAPKAISEVDVVKQLETLSKGKGLDWKVSIVDLLKLLDLDSSRQARIELAKELGCPPELMGGDLAKMNVWLHKTVLRKIAENGGNIPASLLD